jgi:DNA-binding NtrC family response regulator/Tfp pilus assembly protein PilF
VDWISEPLVPLLIQRLPKFIVDRRYGVPGYEYDRIVSLEERLALTQRSEAGTSMPDLGMLADLYLQADSYVPALETIDRLLSLPEARTLTPSQRAVLESKAISCRMAQGHCQAALAHCREVLRTENEVDSLEVRARIHLQCAEALFRLTRLAESRGSAERGLELAHEAADIGLMARALNVLGRVSYRDGDLAGARVHYEQALAFYGRVGDEVSTAYVRNNLGLIHKNLCEWDAAITHLSAALEIRRRHGRFAESANSLVNLGVVHQKSSRWDLAGECFAQARQIYLQVGDQLRLSAVAIGLGNIARLERRFVEAEGQLLEALERARGQGAQREEVLALEFLGELDFDRGRPESALGRYDTALALADRVAPEGDLVVEIERRRAEVLVVLGQVDAADTACRHAQRLARQIDDRLEYAVSFRASAAIAAARGQHDQALEDWRRATVLLASCHESYEQGRTLLDLGRATADTEEARHAFYRAGSLFAPLSTPVWLERAEEGLRRLLQNGTEPAPTRPASLLGRRHRAPGLVACSAGMRRVESLARRAAATELSVLVTGETGTGKELVARTIHALSPRQNKPFLAVNCGALRADLALSQLFGHRKGAFTGAHADGVGLVEAAHGGTLFLDEVGELPHDVQVTILRFLESGEYLRLGETQVRRADVRMIAATNRLLRGAEAERLFRRDLLFRLNEIEIHLPSLRERHEDILPLARHFLAFYGGLDGPRLGPDAESVLASYSWPGNVRELENVMKRIAALHAGKASLDAEALLPFLAHDRGDREAPLPRDERSAILAAYAEANGNKSRVAAMLGVSRKTLYARLKRFNIELP